MPQWSLAQTVYQFIRLETLRDAFSPFCAFAQLTNLTELINSVGVRKMYKNVWKTFLPILNELISSLVVRSVDVHVKLNLNSKFWIVHCRFSKDKLRHLFLKNRIFCKFFANVVKLLPPFKTFSSVQHLYTLYCNFTLYLPTKLNWYQQTNEVKKMMQKSVCFNDRMKKE